MRARWSRSGLVRARHGCLDGPTASFSWFDGLKFIGSLTNTTQPRWLSVFSFISANRKIAFLVFKKQNTVYTAHVWPKAQAGVKEKQRREGREIEREVWVMVIREYRSGYRSVEAAWGGSDTKTALIQTDKHVCPSVHWAFTRTNVLTKWDLMHPRC